MMKKSNLKLALLFSLIAGAKAYGAIGAEIPLANADIGNQAYLSYYTEAGVQKLIQSNIVITRINASYNLALTPNREQTITAGSIAYFSHTLTNTGNIVDSYELTHGYDKTLTVYLDKNNNGVLDSDELTGTQILKDGKFPINSLNPGERTSLIIAVPTASGDEASLYKDKPITAKSIGYSVAGQLSKTATALETIYFQTGGNAIVYKAINKASATSEFEQEIVVSLKLANDDKTPTNIAELFKLTDELQDGFKYVPNSATFKNFEDGTVTALTDDDKDEIGNNSAPLKFEWNNLGKPNSTEKDKITFELPNGIPGNIQLSNPNGVLQFKVKVPINTKVGTISNSVKYEFEPFGTNTKLERESNAVNYEVLKYVRAKFDGMHIPVGNAGETLRFVNKFTNTANSAERYSITLSDQFFPAGTTFRLAMDSKQIGTEEGNHVERPIIDTNGDGKMDTGLVDPGEDNHVNVILYATLPINMPNPGSDYKIVKNATSTFKPDYNVKANDTLGTIKISTVDITNNTSLSEDPNSLGNGLGPERNPVTQISLNPGKVGNFVLHINNTSQYVDEQYSLEVSTKADFSDMALPAGVVVKFKQGGGAEVTKTEKITPGNSQRIDAEVTVAANTGAAVVPLYFRVTSLTTGSRDIKYDSLNINAVRSVQIIPNLTGETYAGGNIVYTHKVRNNGNVLEGDGKASSLNLKTTESIAQWKTETFLDVNKNGIFEPAIDIPFVDFATTNGLKAGEEVTIFARVFAPLGAVAGSTNRTTITPVITQGTYATTPTITSATDDTKILAEKLNIIKYQRLDPAAKWTTGLQKANSGDKIYYRIEVKNTGSDEARTLQLKDSIPFYTTIIYGVESILAPKYRITKADGSFEELTIPNLPTSGTRGDVVVDIPVLAPGATASMEFVVKINGVKGAVIEEESVN
ncbi:MAG: hypothetical protein ACRCZR_08840 [Cetobacterium sp.]|uniref:hypothetical protein n=1 Tax=Cetobacterium sp. TaxID=2071632 RepID=UPI003F355BAF